MTVPTKHRPNCLNHRVYNMLTFLWLKHINSQALQQSIASFFHLGCTSFHIRMARSIRLAPSDAGTAASRRPATKDEQEARWASLVTGSAGEKITKRSKLMIKMSGQIPEESKMEQWCLWFVRFVKASLGQDAPSIKEVNFSDNKLSTKGIKRLLATLKE